MKRLASVCLAAALVALAAPAGAQEAAPVPLAPTMPAAPAVSAGVHEHDGFFLQIQTGPAFLDMTDSEDIATISGGGLGLSIAIGGSPMKNLVIFGEVISQAALNPTLELGGETYEAKKTVTLTFTNVGPGLAYYFGDSNFFVSGSAGLAQASLESDTETYDASGLGLRLGAGKEWWIGKQWGIGVGANVFTATVTDEDDVDWSATSFALNLSATFQ